MIARITIHKAVPLLVGLCVALLTISASSQGTPREKSGNPPAAKRKRPEVRKLDVRVTAEQIAAVNALVRTHHPELASLLAQLKESRPAQYTQAVRNLFRTSVRLAAIQERDMDRYALELRRWKLESQSQLLALRVAKDADNDNLAAELREISEQLVNTRIELLELDHRRQEARLKRLEAQLKELKSTKEQQVASAVQDRVRAATQLVKARGRNAADAKTSPASKVGAKRKRVPDVD